MSDESRAGFSLITHTFFGCVHSSLITQHSSLEKHGEATALHRRRPQEAPRRAPRSWPSAVGITLGPTGRNVIIDKSLRRPDRHQGRRHRLEGNRPARPVREHGRQARQRGRPEDQRRRRRRHHHRHHPGPGRSTRKGCATSPPAANPMAVKRGIDKAVASAVEHLEEKLAKQARPRRKRWQQVATISANNDPKIGKLMADAFEKVGKDGVITVEEGKTSETDARVRRGHAVRQGLHLAVLRRQHARAEVGARRTSPILHLREEALERPRDAAAAGEGRAGRASRCSSSPKTSRAKRWRCWSSTGCAALLERLCGQGPRLRRPPQGDARRHRHPDRRHSSSAKTSASSSRTSSSSSSARPSTVRVEKENCTIIVRADDDREEAIKNRDQTDPHADGPDRERVRQGEVLRAAREADRRRRDHQGRRRRPKPR